MRRRPISAAAALAISGYLQPYGDYFELDIGVGGKAVALWGEGYSYTGPGNVWYASEE